MAIDDRGRHMFTDDDAQARFQENLFDEQLGEGMALHRYICEVVDLAENVMRLSLQEQGDLPEEWIRETATRLLQHAMDLAQDDVVQYLYLCEVTPPYFDPTWGLGINLW